jgi:uncharacterized protein with von Willebrand factor type A (vWA) domain
MSPRGGTDFSPAFGAALVQANKTGPDYTPVLVFLTDG